MQTNLTFNYHLFYTSCIVHSVERNVIITCFVKLKDKARRHDPREKI